MLDGIDLFLCRVGCLVGEWLVGLGEETCDAMVLDENRLFSK